MNNDNEVFDFRTNETGFKSLRAVVLEPQFFGQTDGQMDTNEHNCALFFIGSALKMNKPNFDMNGFI